MLKIFLPLTSPSYASLDHKYYPSPFFKKRFFTPTSYSSGKCIDLPAVSLRFLRPCFALLVRVE